MLSVSENRVLSLLQKGAYFSRWWAIVGGVREAGGMEVEKLSSEFVKLTVTTEGSDLGCERAFNRNITVGELKQRLELLTGAAYNRMKLELRNSNAPAQLVEALNEDDRKIGDYPALDNGLLLKVIDPSMVSIFDETDTVQKMKISEDRYAQLNNVRGFMQKHGLGRFSNRTGDNVIESRMDKENLKGIEIGKRCEVRTKGNPARRGEVRYIGEICLKPGVAFVGVCLDEPLGKNDGTAGEVRYFKCEPKHGVFVRPADIEVGDFPELSLEDELDEI
ncbi:tubulin-specific chaperone B-like [Tropilaelaps mercedesae]|uniref:Tubulin-specific chaperone B-like n=1 Tax=Tropilaelaps mercedesae TaxID=418985 RepID=A0A1V9X1D1_9ACAR|nr:tubulin-specific chaperone B-like [Tropilaelaps mercedesae]